MCNAQKWWADTRKDTESQSLKWSVRFKIGIKHKNAVQSLPIRCHKTIPRYKRNYSIMCSWTKCVKCCFQFGYCDVKQIYSKTKTAHVIYYWKRASWGKMHHRSLSLKIPILGIATVDEVVFCYCGWKRDVMGVGYLYKNKVCFLRVVFYSSFSSSQRNTIISRWSLRLRVCTA